jgi:hypothetical protein
MDHPKLDRASNAVRKSGLVLLNLCRNASLIMVQPTSAATVCELEPAMETGPIMQTGSALYGNKRPKEKRDGHWKLLTPNTSCESS